jgi:hypothetical protein
MPTAAPSRAAWLRARVLDRELAAQRDDRLLGLVQLLADLDAGARDELAHDLRDLGRRHEGVTGGTVETLSSSSRPAYFSRSFSPALREAVARTSLDPGRNSPVGMRPGAQDAKEAK